MNGWKTYVTILLMAAFQLLTQLGWLPGITEADWAIFINVVLALLGIIFNAVGRKKIATTGKIFKY